MSFPLAHFQIDKRAHIQTHITLSLEIAEAIEDVRGKMSNF